jgi:hypothetical protein
MDNARIIRRIPNSSSRKREMKTFSPVIATAGRARPGVSRGEAALEKKPEGGRFQGVK